MILKYGNGIKIGSKQLSISNNSMFVFLLVLLSLMAVFCYSMGTVSADPSMIYVNNGTGNDTWDGEAATWNGTSGPKLSIKNATGTVLDGGTVNLADGTYNGTDNWGITIAKNMVIQGQSRENTIIDAQNLGRIFVISTGKTVIIQNLTLINGYLNDFGGNGGAIHTNGTLTVNQCNFSNNRAWQGVGGAIYGSAGTRISSNECIFSENLASAGGAIYNSFILNVYNSKFIHNTALSYDGGAILSVSPTGFLNVTGSDFQYNTARIGSAIYHDMATYTFTGASQIHFSRFVNNYASIGADIFCGVISFIDARYNWWGSNDRPLGRFSGPVDERSWLILQINATLTTLNSYGSSLVTTNLLYDSGILSDPDHPELYYHDPALDHLPFATGFNTIFSVSPTDEGNFSPGTVPVTNGQAETTFRVGYNSGSGIVSAAVDSEIVNTSIHVDSTTDSIPPQPSANPSGRITNDNSIVLSATDNLDPEPDIYYTTDGSTPTTSSNLYTEPIILLDGITTLKFFALDDGGNPSSVYNETYTIDTIAPTVSVNQPGGNYSHDIRVYFNSIDNLDTFPIIYYTTDGSTPTTSSNWDYSNGYVYILDGITTLRFFAMDDAGNPSPVYNGTYIIDSFPPIVWANPTGRWTNNNSVEIIANDEIDLEPDIYYTTDGSTPTTSSTLYTLPIILPDGVTTLKFFAIDDMGHSSSIYSETYTIDTVLPTASANPVGGTYAYNIYVKLSSADNIDSWPLIYYTTDGSTPTTDSMMCGPNTNIIMPDGVTTLKFFARDNFGNPSPIYTETYIIDTEAPTASAIPTGGTYPNYISVELSATDNFDTSPDIYYTTNGDDPSIYSPHYTEPIHLKDEITTIRFIAVDNGEMSSEIYSETYIVDITPPEFEELPQDNYISNSAIWITLYAFDNWDPNPAIYYTTNGSIPTTSSTLYDSAILLHSVGENILRFFAVDNAGNPSPVYNLTYTIIDTDAPTNLHLMPETGYFGHPIFVELYSWDAVDPEPEIYYTINGDNPTTTSTLYSAPIEISSDGVTTIKFIALDDAGHISDVCTGNYTIDTTPPTITANPVGGTYVDMNSIELLATDLSPIYAIYYTTDGSDPTFSVSEGYSGYVYGGPIIIRSIGQMVLKFYATDIVGNPSQVYTETYNIADNTPPTANATPVGGTYYNNPVYVNLQAQDNFEGGAIYYTLDGTEPDTSSNFYHSPIRLVEGTTTLKFFAVDSSGNPSIIYNETYNLIDNAPPEVIANPTSCVFVSLWWDPEFPYYNNWVYLTATDMDPNPQIYYTLDGSNPTMSSTLYTGAIIIPLPKTVLKFFAIDNKGQASPIHTEYYYAEYYQYQNLDTNPPTAYVNPQGGCYDIPKYVELVASDVDDPITAIYYTLDGSEPILYFDDDYHPARWVGNGLLYTTPFLINRTSILKFAALNMAGTPSPVYMEIYMIGGNAPVDNTPPTVSASVNGGLYNTPQTVTLTSSEPGHIYYTLNGDTPTPSSTEYTVPINIASTTTLKFFAIDRGGNPSPVCTENYTIDTTPPLVSVDVPTGVYNTVKIVNLSINEPGHIYYTTDGSSPTSSSNFYLAPIAITQSTILRFIGYDTAGNPSQAGMASYIIDIPPADTTPPVVNANPEGGLYNSTKVVTLTSSEPGHIYYSTDGSTPTTTSNAYNDPITVPTTTTLKFFAVDLSGNPSTVRTERYILDTTAPTVTANPNAGTYTSVQFVNLILNELGHIYYTTNGETPTVSSTPFIAPLAITQTTVLKFIGIDTAGNPSQVYTETYNIPPVDTVPPTVTVSPGGGTYNSVQTVNLISTEPSHIYYTVNGDTPTTHSTEYSDPIAISTTATLKFFAVDLAGNPSTVRTENYIIDTTAPIIITMDPANGASNVPKNKIISLIFNENIQTGNNWVELKNSSGITILFNTTIINKILTITPINPLAESKYTIAIHTGAIKDLAGNPVGAYISQFTTDATVPIITTIDPKNGATNVPTNKVIVITFNENIQNGTGWIELKNSSGTTIPIIMTITGKIIALTPTNPLVESKYTIAMHTGSVKDLAGNLVGAYISQFTTDATVPIITTIDPKNGATNVPTNKVIVITFNENIQNGTGWIELKNSSGTAILFNTTIINKILTITPINPLAESKYTIAIHTGAIKDLAGNPVGAYISQFTTDATAPIITTIDPTNYAVNVDSNKIITITFNENIQNGTGWIELKNSSGTIIPTTMTITGKVITLTPTNPLAESKYTIAIHTGSVKDLAGNPVAAKSSTFSLGTSPTVNTIDPSNGTVNVPTNKIITVTFNKKIKNGTGQIELKNSLGSLIPFTTTINDKILTITPTNQLVNNTKYLLKIYYNAVTDQAGNPNNNKDITFTVGTT